jgi:ATP-dependent Clp protease protease subunit
MRTRVRFTCRKIEPQDLKAAGLTEVDRMGFRLEASDITTLYVYGVVGDEFDGLDASSLSREIANVKTPIHMRIDSPGGYYYDAIDIYSALVQHPHEVTAHIAGQAASAATIIAAAADHVSIQEGSSYMIHRASSYAIVGGNAEQWEDSLSQQRVIIETMKEVDDAIIEIISTRSDNPISDVRKWIAKGPNEDGGTTFSAKDAVETGLVDELIKPRGKSRTAAMEPVVPSYKTQLQQYATRIVQAKLTSLSR